MVEGYEVWHIECPKCGHKSEREAGNELVGTQARWKCGKCGHRGATLTRVWHVGEKSKRMQP